MFQPFEVTLPRRPGRVTDIRDYGAVAGGRVSNTAAFAAAIEATAATGGGIVEIPNGIWLSGPIRLLSGVELHLADNAVLIFTKNQEEYPLIVTDYEGIRRIRTVSQITAEDAEDVSITGRGVINGNGQLWRPVKKFKTTERQWKRLLEKSSYVIESKEGGIWVPTQSVYDARYAGEVFPDTCETEEASLEKAAPYYDFYRPVMLSLRRCRRVLLDGVRLQNSAAWNVHPWFCEDLTIRNISILNAPYVQNGDGLDVDSCNRVHIHHCEFQTGDDGICLKAGKDREARKLLQPCENVLIHDCKVYQSPSGFVIGSEMSRGVRNVLVHDCTFIESHTGICFKSAIGRGGVVENITMEDIQMVNIQGRPVSISMDYVHNLMDYYDPVAQTDDPEDIPEFRDICFRRCRCTSAGMPLRVESLAGHPETVHDVVFEDCELEVET
ncbi:MAG: glycoside hydrolase family 28 protein [Butyrivibrio sp.]|nr:glycoside hydrolase family 28 protein [Butyrivibrio sp.]